MVLLGYRVFEKIKIKKFPRLLVCLNIQIWRYRVKIVFYWVIGYLRKLKSKIRKAKNVDIKKLKLGGKNYDK